MNKIGKMIKVRKVKKMSDAFTLFREAEIRSDNRQEHIQVVLERWEERFGDRTPIVVENVLKVLQAVQSRLNASKDPTELAKDEKQQQALIDIIAGAKAIQSAGAGATMALRSYVQQVSGEKQGLSPEQIELEAVKQAGRGSQASREVTDALKAYELAIQQGNQQQAEEIKNEFARTYGFYQQLMNRINAGGQQTPPDVPQNQQIPTQQTQPQSTPTAPSQPPVTTPARGTPGAPRF